MVYTGYIATIIMPYTNTLTPCNNTGTVLSYCIIIAQGNLKLPLRVSLLHYLELAVPGNTRAGGDVPEFYIRQTVEKENSFRLTDLTFHSS